MFIAADRYTDLGSIYLSLSDVQRDFTETERRDADKLLGTFHAAFAVAWHVNDISFIESILYQYVLARMERVNESVC